MKVVYTDRAIKSLEEALYFALEEQGIPKGKIDSLKERLFDRADSLAINPYKGQQEDYLEHLGEGHRRIIENYFKIIYKIEHETIYITDFFDSRQAPNKMKG